MIIPNKIQNFYCVIFTKCSTERYIRLLLEVSVAARDIYKQNNTYMTLYITFVMEHIKHDKTPAHDR